jgi:hypothetical protein
MLETIAIILIILWLLGLVTSTTMGGFIHILLVIAVVVILLRFIRRWATAPFFERRSTVGRSASGREKWSVSNAILFIDLEVTMLKIRNVVLVLGVLMSPLASAATQVSIGIAVPGVSIGINLPAYPRLVRVPNYPVYYAPELQANFFFYDGMYWVYQGDNWYASSWYNGPWGLVEPYAVPAYVLRVPVRYYRRPPVYFHGWQHDAPPRWGDHWGHDWQQQRSDWDKGDRRAAPKPAPLPSYQRQYSGERYPRQMEQQYQLQQQKYRYQPRDPVVQKHYQEQGKSQGHGQSQGQGQGKGHNK